MTEKEKGGVGHLKKLVTNIDNNRKNIEARSDVAGNISQAKQSFGQFQSVIKGQTNTINSLKAFQKSMSSDNSRNIQLKKFYISFAEKAKSEILKLIKIGQSVFVMTAQKSTRQDDYQKVTGQLMKSITALKQESDNPEKIYNAVNRFLAVRDNILCQLFRVMIYKKNLLWRDLNMKFDDYIHGEVKASLLKIKQNEQKYGYIPSSIHFRFPKPESESQSPLFDLISIIYQDQNQLIDSMKNFSKLNEDPQLIQDISKNQHTVKGLREKIQVLTRNYNTLMEKYRNLQISKGKNQLSPNQEKSLNEKIEDLQAQVQKKNQDLFQLRQVYTKSQSTIQNLKDKTKELEDEISKWQNFQMPKIKQLELAQKSLLEEFAKTKKDFETYSGLYQNEREDKIKAYSDLKDEKNRLNQMANILGRERRKIKQLKAELLRKDQIIFELVQKAPDP